MRSVIFVIALLTSSASAGWSQSANPVRQGPANVPEFSPAFAEQTRAPAMPQAHDLVAEVFARGLSHPWGIATLPGGQGFLVTERPGRMRHVSARGVVGPPLVGLPPVAAEGQGGLLDVAIGPDFARDRLIYWTYAKPVSGRFATAAARGRLSADLTAITGATDIFVQTPLSATPAHYGSRIVFDGDGHAFVTTGEHSSARERVLAQDLTTTFGKVVRISLDGGIPAGNPFADLTAARPEIWSLGHRNIQGAFVDDGALWTIEHGPQGGDELNRIRAGRNYGWPVITYGEDYSGRAIGGAETARDGMEQPIYYWDPVIAPAGMLRYDGGLFRRWTGDILISSLNPGGIVRLRLRDGLVVGEQRLLAPLGRVRDLEIAPDGSLLALLDRADGLIARIRPK